MHRLFFITGALFAGLSVAIGAATGHVDKNPYTELEMLWLAKATRYQFYHGLALLCVALASVNFPAAARMLMLSGFGFIFGTLFFCGSLYLMTFTGISAGYLTPLGGFGFLAGWLCAAVAGLRMTPQQ